ncbi:MAG: O-antigen ligase family protein [Halanaerobiales bacterium]|nr:O-antigen ligase family protein [Halanaerobiales bacterium]
MKLTDTNYDKLITYILIAIIAITPLLYFPYVEKGDLYPTGSNQYQLIRYDNIYKPKITAVYYLVLLLAVIILLKQYYDKNKIKTDLNNISIFLFLTFTILSTIFSKYYYQSIYGRPFRWEGLITYISYVLIFITAGYFIKKLRHLKKIIKYLFISGSLISIYGLIQFYGLDFIKRDPLRVNMSRSFSTLGNPNFAASYIAIILSLSLVLYVFSEKKNKLYKYGFFSSLFFAFLIATSTRSALVGFLVSTVIFITLFHKYLRNNFKKIIIIILIFITIFGIMDSGQQYYYSRRVLSLFTDVQTLATSEDETEIEKIGSKRFVIYKFSIPLLVKNPLLGSGPDTFDKVFPHDEFNELSEGTGRKIVDKAHNEYLQIGITLGLPALLFYLLLLYNIYKKGFQVLKKVKNKMTDLNIYHVALFMAVISYTVTALFNISVVCVAPVFWAILGLNVAASKMEE